MVGNEEILRMSLEPFEPEIKGRDKACLVGAPGPGNAGVVRKLLKWLLSYEPLQSQSPKPCLHKYNI